MKKVLFFGLYFLLLSSQMFAHDIVGFWKSVDEKTHEAQSIIAIYEYQGKYYGRIIATYDEDDGQVKDTIYNPKERAPGVKGNPFYAGMDIIWDLQKQGPRYTNGKILDPEHGRVYGAELWRTKDNNLNVRGKILFFGRNQEWPPATDNDFPPNFKKPDLTQLTPQIPQVK